MPATDERGPLSDDEAISAMLPPEDDTEAEEESAEAPLETEETAEDEAEAEEVEGDDEADPDDEEGDETEDVQAQPDTFTVKVDGEEIEVSREELIRGYSGQQYVQKGMREAAEMRKELQSQREQFAELVQRMMQDGASPRPVEPNPELAQTDPVGYMQDRAVYDQQLAQWQAQQQALAEQTEQYQQLQQREREQRLADEREKLMAIIPEFSDPQKAKEIQGAIVRAGEAYGLTSEELGSIVDHRHIAILNDARQWRELQAKTQKVAQKTAKARPVVKAKAAKSATAKARNAEAKARERLKKTGSVDDALALMFKGT